MVQCRVSVATTGKGGGVRCSLTALSDSPHLREVDDAHILVRGARMQPLELLRLIARRNQRALRVRQRRATLELGLHAAW